MNVHRGKKGRHEEMLQSAGRNMDGWLHLCSYIINTHNSLGSTKEGRRPKIVIFYPLLCPSHDITITLLMPLLCPLLADFPSPLDILFNAAQGASIKTSEVWGEADQAKLVWGLVILLLISSLACLGCLQRLGCLPKYTIPFWIRLLTRMLLFWVSSMWLQFDKYFALLNILNPGQCREGPSSIINFSLQSCQ